VGETINYTLTVVNTGNVTLTGIQIGDENAVVTNPMVGSLAPGATGGTTATHITNSEDVGNLLHDNTAVLNHDAGNATASEHVVLPNGSSGFAMLEGAVVEPTPEALKLGWGFLFSDGGATMESAFALKFEGDLLFN
jgi:hypothetical protein